MPALGALLVVAGTSSVKPRDVRALVDAGWPSMLAGGTTFAATLFLPIQAAVALGFLRGRQLLGATLIEVPGSYAKELRTANGRLYSSGMSQDAYDHVSRSGKLEVTRHVRGHRATAVVWQSTREAVADATEFIARARREHG